MLMDERPEPTPFAREMLRRRVAAGLETQAEAARHCDVTSSLWGQVELGYQSMGKDANGVQRYKPVSPKRWFVIKVAVGLNWDRAEALDLAGFDPTPDPHDPPPNLPVWDIKDDWPRLTEAQKFAYKLLMHVTVNPNANIAAMLADSPAARGLFSDVSDTPAGEPTHI